ncbi:reverse transcriptase domain-containing protein, partial [Tanacetum coccineum]
VIDKSIHTGYIQAIRSAQHVIYIENQYFIVSSYAWPDYKDAGIDASDCAMEAQTLSKNRARKCKKCNWIHTGHVYSAEGVRAGAKSASIAAVANAALTEVQGPVMKRFCRQGEQVLAVPDANEEETSKLGAKLQAELTPTPRAWRLNLTRETIKEGSRVPATEQEKRYREEIMDATTPFHRVWITHLLKILNTKSEMLTGLATIQLEFLN